MGLLSKVFSTPVDSFVSPQKLYKIDFPKGWRKIYSLRKNSPISFFSKEYKGILQISAAFHPDLNYQYSANNEFEVVKKEHPRATLSTISNKQVISWATDDKCESIILFAFILGEKNVKLFATYTYGYTEFNLEEVNSECAKVNTLLEKLNFV